MLHATNATTRNGKIDCHEEEEEFLTTPEAAAFYRAAVPTLEGWRVKGGGPPFIRLGRKIVYAKSDLVAFAQRNRRVSTSDAGAPVLDEGERA